MINFSQDPKLCKLYNRSFEAAAKAIGVGTEENFSVNTSEGTVAMFDNIHHFLLVMSSRFEK